MVEITIGSSTYQAYSDVADADEYLSASLFATTWQALEEDAKAQVLVTATRYLDAFKWKGIKTDEAQPLEWPGVNTGVSPSDEAAYARFLNGFFELCALISEDPTILQNANSGSNVQRAKGGEAEVWFFKSTIESASTFPPSVHNWMKDLLAGSGGGALSFASSVDCDFTSVFDDPPNRSGGLY